MSPAQERFSANRRWWVLEPASAGFARYIVAVALIGAALLLRYALRSWLGPNVPYLQFFPAILIAAWYGGRGPGVVATATASLAAMYFFLPPAGLAVGQTADLVPLSLFVATGLGIAWTNHLLRNAERECRAEAALEIERAERLDGVINTTVDGIIVINSTGTIEAFNRGAERLFGIDIALDLGIGEIAEMHQRGIEGVEGSTPTHHANRGAECNRPAGHLLQLGNRGLAAPGLAEPETIQVGHLV